MHDTKNNQSIYKNEHHIMNNIGLPKEICWKTSSEIADNIPEKLKPWLYHRDSFVERLKTFGIQSQINVLSEEWNKPLSQESELLGMNLEKAFIREVSIFSDKIIWMKARSIFPEESLEGINQKLLTLKNMSLGSVIFTDPNLIRSEFEYALLSNGCWARRSIFNFNKKPILLTEIFFQSVADL